jgi:uncharacterized protein (DUF934 family)
MKIIKDKQITEDNWTHIADGDAIPTGDFTVSLSRWKEEKEKLSQHQERIGIRLSPADTVEEIAGDLKAIKSIALDFAVFTDGRSFSQARLLRDQYKFEGEIRAMGNYMSDQIFYLSRVGVNAFQLENSDELDLALSMLNDFSVSYQQSSN